MIINVHHDLMRRLLIALALTHFAVFAYCQQVIDIIDLDIKGKLVRTDNVFDRFNTGDYPAVYEDASNLPDQIRSSAGYFVSFRTNSRAIQVKIDYRNPKHKESCDLYISKEGTWLYAGSHRSCSHGKTVDLVRNMNGAEHDCLVYFPLQSPIKSMSLIIDDGARISPIDNPFRHRIVALGSSFTQGSGVTRPGLTWSAQLSRMTGLLFMNMGFCGNCKLQPFYAEVIGSSDAEAYVIDGFSNPSAQQIKDRLFPFIDALRNAEKVSGKAPKPIIFIKTIWREGNNFNVTKLNRELDKMAAADEMMTKAVKKYEHVYWVQTTDATDHKYHETCTDGTHPNDYGYTLWAESIRKPVTGILSKYGIK